MIADRVVMITGCGRGLGRALSLAFADEDYCVVGIARNREQFKDVAGNAKRGSFFGYQADVSQWDSLNDTINQVIERFGKIDVVFNNAAVYPKVNFLDETPAAWAEAISINVDGVAYCCKGVLPHMIRSGYGRIYNVGSFADGAPIRDSAAYSTSKGALHALTKAIAADIDHLQIDIQVHEWVPGHLNTQMSDFTGIDPAVSAQWAVQIVKSDDASSKCCLFENDQEWTQKKSLKERISDKLIFWKT